MKCSTPTASARKYSPITVIVLLLCKWTCFWHHIPIIFRKSDCIWRFSFSLRHAYKLSPETLSFLEASPGRRVKKQDLKMTHLAKAISSRAHCHPHLRPAPQGWKKGLHPCILPVMVEPSSWEQSPRRPKGKTLHTGTAFPEPSSTEDRPRNTPCWISNVSTSIC